MSKRIFVCVRQKKRDTFVSLFFQYGINLIQRSHSVVCERDLGDLALRQLTSDLSV